MGQINGLSAVRMVRRMMPLRNGFTLIEILVVLFVVAMLAALVAPNVLQHVGTAKEQAARSQIEMIAAALDAYKLDNGEYPTTDQGLQALRALPTAEPSPKHWKGPYLRKALPTDPWEQAFIYISPGVANPWGYDLQSYGKDGVAGGVGEAADIRSW